MICDQASSLASKADAEPTEKEIENAKRVMKYLEQESEASYLQYFQSFSQDLFARVSKVIIDILKLL